MVRLADLKTCIETCGTTGHALSGGAIPDGMIRRIYKIRLQQRGATLSNVYLYGNLGATIGATIDQFQFAVPLQIIEFPEDSVKENSAPIYHLNRATYDSLFVSVEVASVDLFAIYANEYV